MSIFERIRGARTPKVDLSWLTDDLAIGRAPLENEWPAIQAAGVRAVLDLRAELDERSPSGSGIEGLRYLHIPIVEYEAPGEAQLRLATTWVTERINSGERVLIHCREGRGRSAMVACASLSRLGVPIRDAYRMLLRVRPQASLSEPQQTALQRFGEGPGESAAPATEP